MYSAAVRSHVVVRLVICLKAKQAFSFPTQTSNSSPCIAMR